MIRMTTPLILAAASAMAGASAAQAAPISMPKAEAKMDQQDGNGGPSTRGADVGFDGRATENFTWVNGETIDWSLSYEAGILTFDWGGAVATTAADYSGYTLTSLSGYVRSTAQNGQNGAPQLTVDINEIGGVDPAAMTALYGSGVNDYLVDGLRVTGDWTVTGTARADWNDGDLNKSPNSRLAFKMTGELTPSQFLFPQQNVDVPAPGALALLGLGLGAVAMRRRKR
ncbi:MAG: PEP-CTERM sorting domain-containing protein [Pacificimonas sp.]|jgi:hypothetical protein|nr:PEP-CTERM sorting domain-containing protein [Pacificimonas sp.]